MLEYLFSTTGQSWLTPVMLTVVVVALIVILLTPVKVRNEQVLKVPLRAIILIAALVTLLLIMWVGQVLLALT
jgi:hypothetical protein